MSLQRLHLLSDCSSASHIYLMCHRLLMVHIGTQWQSRFLLLFADCEINSIVGWLGATTALAAVCGLLPWPGFLVAELSQSSPFCFRCGMWLEPFDPINPLAKACVFVLGQCQDLARFLFFIFFVFLLYAKIKLLLAEFSGVLCSLSHKVLKAGRAL